MKHTIVFGISSGIAAYKVVNLVTNLRKRDIEVIVTMTPHATRMIDQSEFIKATRHKVFTELFPEGFDYHDVLEKNTVEHIQVADAADLFVVAPATANIIAKLAHGIADDFVTTVAIATQAPMLICPSMNLHMWQHPSVQENLSILRSRGCYIVDPDSGHLACGYEGVGRLADGIKIEKEISHILRVRNQLRGKRVLVTAGGTSESIDAVRMITNRSTGKMGIAIAEECAKRGAEVLLLKAKTAVPSHVKTEVFETTAELASLVAKHVKEYEYMFHVAAVADFSTDTPPEAKIDSSKEFTLHLTPTSKISDQIKIWNPEIIFIGFKAEYNVSDNELEQKAVEKMKKSHADYIVANDVSREGVGFEADTNECILISTSGKRKRLAKQSKIQIARSIIDFVC